ncbi:hypothetical protein PG996_001557 [Apiospora saccharicola]|uniref:Uncharacterized protein n=1 Tax=Apiospora saccharicola TaxID=335842 RepID=A0ABR1WJV2_9PEZI
MPATASAAPMGGAWAVASANAERHDDEFYAAAKKRREEAIARGEDPYAEFKQKVADGRAAGDMPQSEKLWRKLTGKDGRQQRKKDGAEEKAAISSKDGRQ